LAYDKEVNASVRQTPQLRETKQDEEAEIFSRVRLISGWPTIN
jgi:hypothetical protein